MSKKKSNTSDKNNSDKTLKISSGGSIKSGSVRGLGRASSSSEKASKRSFVPPKHILPKEKKEDK